MLIPGCPVSGGGINSARRRGRLDGVRGIPNTTLSPPIMIDRLISGTHAHRSLVPALMSVFGHCTSLRCLSILSHSCMVHECIAVSGHLRFGRMVRIFHMLL